ncbi:hypothetical protein [Aurantibacter sp.]|uniref:hypothetical protein n=1 Tax=Aurantibacter sp. TaxID=2807103 RepID=UPI0035C7F6B1
MRFLFFFLFLFVNISFAQSDYTISIDGKVYDLSINEEQDFLVNGQNIKIKVAINDTLIFKKDFISFKHLSKNSIANTKIDRGINQYIMMTAGGTGVILQKYDDFDPSMIKEMMLSELTKESVSYGYKLVREDYKRKLESGQEVNVLKAVLEYKGEYEYYEVSTCSKKDEGVLIATMITVDEFDDGGKEMIELFWKTLNVL